MAVELKDLTKRSENYSQWYNELVVKADLSEESKRTKIAGMVTGIVATQQASQNFEQGMEAESQQQNLQRK